MADRVLEIEKLYRRAAVETADAEARTVGVQWTSGAPVLRVINGVRAFEILSLDPKHVRLGRLNGGAPLLNSHQTYEIDNVIGVVVENSARVAASGGTATVRFSKRADVEPIWGDVRDGIVRNLSVGYIVHRFVEEAAGADGIPIYRAVDWEPYELSFVSIPADAKAQTRGGGPRYSCEIVGLDAPAELDAAARRALEDEIRCARLTLMQLTQRLLDADCGAS
jgi:hypothetical protein